MLQCNVISHWLGACTDRTLDTSSQVTSPSVWLAYTMAYIQFLCEKAMVTPQSLIWHQRLQGFCPRGQTPQEGSDLTVEIRDECKSADMWWSWDLTVEIRDICKLCQQVVVRLAALYIRMLGSHSTIEHLLCGLAECQLAWSNMVVADALVPSRNQGISNHHADCTMTYCTLQLKHGHFFQTPAKGIP